MSRPGRTILVPMLCAWMAVFAAAPLAGQASALQTASAPQTASAHTLTDSAIDAQTTAVALQLRCPICQGESIEESPAQLAKQMRDVVREQIAAGKTPDEVKAYFASKYGEWILLQPKASGFNVLIYILPFALIAGGLAVIVVAVRRWSGSNGNATPKPQS